MSNTRIYWLHAISPTHVGTGRGVGYIDLPVTLSAPAQLIESWKLVSVPAKPDAAASKPQPKHR